MKWRIMSVFTKCSPLLVIMLLMATVSLNVRICVFQYFSNSKELDSQCVIVEKTRNNFLISLSQKIRDKAMGILKTIGPYLKAHN